VAEWDQIDFVYPQNIPTMISPEERRYLYWLGSRAWTGAGHIVEMGPWLGGSTVCLAAGMAASGRDARSKLHVYDAFVWRDYMSDRSPHNLESGESFESLFRENVREYEDVIVVNRATLPDESVSNDSFAEATRVGEDGRASPVAWRSGEPVEILFVDGAKSWSGFISLLKTFTPHLLANQSLLVLQDYKSWQAYWVPAIAELLSAHLALEHVLHQNTVTFRLTSPIGDGALESIPNWEELTADECEKLIDLAAERLERRSDKHTAAVVRLSAVRLWMHKGDVSRAVERFEESERTWPIGTRAANLRTARKWLTKETSRPLPESTRTKIRGGMTALHGALRKAVRRWKERNRKS